MRCQSMGLPPISTIGLGLTCVSSARRVPSPPARITVFMCAPSSALHRAFAPRAVRLRVMRVVGVTFAGVPANFIEYDAERVGPQACKRRQDAGHGLARGLARARHYYDAVHRRGHFEGVGEAQ